MSQANPNNEQQDALESIKLSRIVAPILIGLAVVVYLMYQQLDIEELRKINWNFHIFFFIFLAIFMYVLRHFFYSWRLKIMTGNEFSWPKSFELIVLWEFASAVSPTSVGGAGVALFLLAQEKLSTAKTVSVVIYSLVLDTIFFVVSLPILYMVLGPVIIRPDMKSLTDLDGFGYTFIGVLIFMTIYGFIFFYGLFINPNTIKSLMMWFARLPFLKRFRNDIEQTATDVVLTSQELQQKNTFFHFKALVATFGAWITRFLAINFIIIALVQATPLDLLNQAIIYARGETMHVVTAFSPTPGGAGIAEYLFGGFFTDYVSEGIASLIALIWRLITYYSYLILGAIVIPVWIREVLLRRRQNASESSS